LGKETGPTLCKSDFKLGSGFRDLKQNKHLLLHRIQSIRTSLIYNTLHLVSLAVFGKLNWHYGIFCLYKSSLTQPCLTWLNLSKLTIAQMRTLKGLPGPAWGNTLPETSFKCYQNAHNKAYSWNSLDSLGWHLKPYTFLILTVWPPNEILSCVFLETKIYDFLVSHTSRQIL